MSVPLCIGGAAVPRRGRSRGEYGMTLARSSPVHASFENWEGERRDLLSRRISELGLTIEGSLVERLVAQLYEELEARGLAFKPPVYLSDQWGCPDGTALIGIPFYLADPRLAREYMLKTSMIASLRRSECA